MNKCDTKGNKAVNKMAIDVLHDHFKNRNGLGEDDDNDIVFPTNIRVILSYSVNSTQKDSNCVYLKKKSNLFFM